jgi:Tfp pilus assembly protein PilZ
MTIQTTISDHALRQSQRRGISRDVIELIISHNDRSQKVPGRGRAIWISPRGRDALIRAGLRVALVERSAGVRLVVHIEDDVVLTAEHCCKRRRWV